MSYDHLLDFVHRATDGQLVGLSYDSSHGGDQLVIGTVRDARMPEYTDVVDSVGDVYRVWLGSGIEGVEDGDVKKFAPGINSRKVGTFNMAEVLEEAEE